MSRITAPSDLGKIKTPEEFMRHASQLVSEVVKVVNGNLEFSNMLTQQVDVSFTAANTDLAIAHNLNKTGVKYIVVSKTATCDVYDGAAVDTASTIYLKSTAVADVSLILF